MEIDFTTALGRLLSDPALRREFARNRVVMAQRLAVRDVDLAAFLSLDAEGLETQAQTLLSKRLYEVGRLLPATFEQLGAHGRTYFLEYANKRWPKGHSRHIDDAAGFCRYLGEIGVSNLCRAEFNRVRFMIGGQRFSVHIVQDFPMKNGRRTALQLFFRRRDRSIRQAALFF